MDYIIVGTAGHVDHGKTQLVKALTGINTDRLKEEQNRGISIELGFAPLKLPNGQKIGLVDVPGHEKFVKQMLAGVGGMDLVLFIVAADEGVMPQTREHLDIINLLQVKQGIIVITKADLVEPDWLELVQEEVKETFQGTVLEGAPIQVVSAITGQGIPELKERLQELIAQTPAKPATGKVRLPIDRVFSITGFGTVVTGTLWSGKIRLGDILEILPEGLQSRVRTLQVHGQQVEEAVAGQRVAINLHGVEVGEIQRGSVVVTPGSLTPSRWIDVQLHLLPHAPELENRTRVRAHLGTSEVLGRVSLLDRDTLKPGETAFAQLMLEDLLVSAKGDRFIIRSYSPVHTIGGGVIIEPKGVKLKRLKPEVLKVLATKLQGSPEELVEEILQRVEGPFLTQKELVQQSNLTEKEVEEAVTKLQEENKVKLVSGEEVWLADQKRYEALLQDVRESLQRYHKEYPLRPGFPKEELRSRKFNQYDTKLFNALLQAWAQEGLIQLQENNLALAQFTPQPNEKERKLLQGIEKLYLEHKFQPPDWKEVVARFKLGEKEAQELMRYLLWQGTLHKINEELYFHAQAIEGAKEQIKAYIQQHGSVQLGEVRDLLNSSRKFVLPLLEYFDQIKFTRRIQDKRILYK